MKNAWREMRKNDIIANLIKFILLKNQNGWVGGGSSSFLGVFRKKNVEWRKLDANCPWAAGNM